jgi:hypothetical protein
LYSDLEGLSKLLESSQKLNEEAAGGSGIAGGARALGPGDIGPSKAEVAPAGRAKAVTKDIWGDDDVKEGDLFSTHVDPSDKRPEPSYKVPLRSLQRGAIFNFLRFRLFTASRWAAATYFWECLARTFALSLLFSIVHYSPRIQARTPPL